MGKAPCRGVMGTKLTNFCDYEYTILQDFVTFLLRNFNGIKQADIIQIEFPPISLL